MIQQSTNPLTSRWLTSPDCRLTSLMSPQNVPYIRYCSSLCQHKNTTNKYMYITIDIGKPYWISKSNILRARIATDAHVRMLISLVALLHVTINELTSLESESKTLKLCALLTRLSKKVSRLCRRNTTHWKGTTEHPSIVWVSVGLAGPKPANKEDKSIMVDSHAGAILWNTLYTYTMDMSFKTLNFTKEFCKICINYFCAAALPTVDKLPVHTSTSYPPHLGPQLQNKIPVYFKQY